MSDNWVVQNLENALKTWNEKLAEIWQLITQSPEEFKGGTIWKAILDIHGAVQAIGLALLVLFFVVGVMKTCGSFVDVKTQYRTFHRKRTFQHEPKGTLLYVVLFFSSFPNDKKVVRLNAYYEI